MLGSSLERGKAGRLQSSFGLENGNPLDVDRAPVRVPLARRKADLVAIIVDAMAHTVYPAGAEGLIHRFRPGNARAARAALHETDHQRGARFGVLGQPSAKFSSGREVGWFQGEKGGGVFGQRSR